MNLAEQLSTGAAQLGLALSVEQQGKLLTYLALIQKWNEVYNLTAITEAQHMLTHHVLDALSVVAPLERHMVSEGLVQARLVDVGSGAGLPGLVIGLCLPNVQVVCVDVVGKKTAFIQQAAGELGLKNVTAHHGRVEDMQVVGGADVFTCRAFAKLDVFAEGTRHLAKPGSVWLAMKAQTAAVEAAELPSWIEMFHVEQLNVPFLNEQRALAWMRRVG